MARERLHGRIYSRPISRRKENRTEENKAVFPRGRRTFKKTVLYASLTLRRCNPWVLMRFSVDRTQLIHVYISEWENVVSMHEFWSRARRLVGKNGGNFLVFPVSNILTSLMANHFSLDKINLSSFRILLFARGIQLRNFDEKTFFFLHNSFSTCCIRINTPLNI